MNTANLKKYAPAARRDFIRAVTDRAAKVGVTASSAAHVELRGDVAFISGQAFPRQAAEQRKALDKLIQRNGFHAVMEQVAYTWFNRFMAIRFMELHGYLSHGYRVLSNANGKLTPEIMEHAESVTLPGVDRERVISLKLDGTKDEELCRLLLLGQCRALHKTMPFLFEPIDDVTELLLPDLLLATDSVIRKMVIEIEESNWEQVEVIGWLYQFYISEKKDEVIGKVVKSEDIPAATQLFTPNWIVKYMTQNSLGRKWMATYPNSPLKAKMEYYVEPAEQTEEVQAQLDAITPKSLNPDEITMIDPACGSGHILVEGYDLFKEIYLERGYSRREIPHLILTKNLYGLEIDDRAAQMAGFALLMKARADDRGILDNPPKLNVLALQSSEGLDASEISAELLKEEVVPFVPSLEMFAETKSQPVLTERRLRNITEKDIRALIDLFTDVKTFGSLITVPDDLAAKLADFRRISEDTALGSDVLTQRHGRDLTMLVRQAEILAAKHHVSVMNPPYMGSRHMPSCLKTFAGHKYPKGKSDLCAMFTERGISFLQHFGWLSMITIESWMFLSSYEKLRENVVEDTTIGSLIHMPYDGKQPTPMGINFGTSAYCLQMLAAPDYTGRYSRIQYTNLTDLGEPRTRVIVTEPKFKANPHEFEKLPGSPIAYWLTDKVREAFEVGNLLECIAPCRQGLATADNSRFLRMWWEVSFGRVGFSMNSRSEAKASGKKWFPYNKGGEFRKWYGNNEYVVNWDDDGRDIRSFVDAKGKARSRAQNTEFYFLPSITWTFVSSAYFGVRSCDKGFLFDVGGSSAFPPQEALLSVLSFLASNVAPVFLAALNPTLNFQVGNIAALPLHPDINLLRDQLDEIAVQAVTISRADWDSFETSWDFSRLFLSMGVAHISYSHKAYELLTASRRTDMRKLESQNNRAWMGMYGLQADMSPDVTDDLITLARSDLKRDVRTLISYAIGCLMGRYSLDEPGLIYAHCGSEGFDPSRYKSVPADEDGILPLTEFDWFGDEDTANRIAHFVATAWPVETFDENLKFIADSLGPKADEEPLDTIRLYLASGFYKDHLQTYKRRPIYWLFNSGKERAFQALVYLHRYNEGTLARMRTEYVLPLMSRITARVEQLRADIDASPSAVERRRRTNEYDKLRKHAVELQGFDEKLRHYSDRRIRLELDDGVKVNYAKFGDLLAEVKAVTGGTDD